MIEILVDVCRVRSVNLERLCAQRPLIGRNSGAI